MSSWLFWGPFSSSLWPSSWSSSWSSSWPWWLLNFQHRPTRAGGERPLLEQLHRRQGLHDHHNHHVDYLGRLCDHLHLSLHVHHIHHVDYLGLLGDHLHLSLSLRYHHIHGVDYLGRLGDYLHPSLSLCYHHINDCGLWCCWSWMWYSWWLSSPSRSYF